MRPAPGECLGLPFGFEKAAALGPSAFPAAEAAVPGVSAGEARGVMEGVGWRPASVLPSGRLLGSWGARSPPSLRPLGEEGESSGERSGAPSLPGAGLPRGVGLPRSAGAGPGRPGRASPLPSGRGILSPFVPGSSEDCPGEVCLCPFYRREPAAALCLEGEFSILCGQR